MSINKPSAKFYITITIEDFIGISINDPGIVEPLIFKNKTETVEWWNKAQLSLNLVFYLKMKNTKRMLLLLKVFTVVVTAI